MDDPRVPDLLRKGWDLTGLWVSTHLDAHGNPSSKDLADIFTGFAPKPRGVRSKYGDFLEYAEYWFGGSAVRIGKGVYVVQASYSRVNATSTFMVVTRNKSGRFEALWNIKDLARQHYAAKDEIGRWAHLVQRAYYNGPLVVSRIIPVRPAANGHSRFLVNAYQDAEGGTVLAQVSIWEWAGMVANPLLVEAYQYAADAHGFQFDGTTVRMATKERLGMLFSCGMCPEPRGIWTIRITKTGIENLGHRFVEPQYKWADELLSALNSGMDAANLADASVLAALREKMKEIKADYAAAHVDITDDHWGMLDSCKIVRESTDGGVFELMLDEAQLRFTYVLRSNGPYFTNVRIIR